MIVTSIRNKFNLTDDEMYLLNEKCISRQAFANRITQCGWSKDKALHQDICHREMLLPEEKQLLEDNRISISTYSKRRKRGWSKEDALNTKPRCYVKI